MLLKIIHTRVVTVAQQSGPKTEKSSRMLHIWHVVYWHKIACTWKIGCVCGWLPGSNDSIVMQTNEYPMEVPPFGSGPPDKLSAGGTARFRIFDATNILPKKNPWYDLPDAVLFDQWNKLAIQFTVQSLGSGNNVVIVS